MKRLSRIASWILCYLLYKVLSLQRSLNFQTIDLMLTSPPLLTHRHATTTKTRHVTHPLTNPWIQPSPPFASNNTLNLQRLPVYLSRCVCVCVFASMSVCVRVCVAGCSPNSAAPAVCPSLENVTAECRRKESPAEAGGGTEGGRGVNQERQRGEGGGSRKGRGGVVRQVGAGRWGGRKVGQSWRTQQF